LRRLRGEGYGAGGFDYESLRAPTAEEGGVDEDVEREQEVVEEYCIEDVSRETSRRASLVDYL
jgi:hypothetical protein